VLDCDNEARYDNSFLYGWINLSGNSAADVANPKYRPYSVFGVEATLEGIRQCVTSPLKELTVPRVLCEKTEESPHIDESLMGSLVKFSI
jgi:hypothetical protein